MAPVAPLAATPTPAAGSQQILSAADTHKSTPEIFAGLVAATTKEDLRDAGAEAMAHYVRKLEEDIRSLKAQVSDLSGGRDALRTQFHESDKGAAVLTTKLKWAHSQLRAQNLMDWMFNFLFALGGAAVGFGVSWPEITIGSRIVISSIGFLVISAPVLYKCVLYLKTPMPE